MAGTSRPFWQAVTCAFKTNRASIRPEAIDSMHVARDARAEYFKHGMKIRVRCRDVVLLSVVLVAMAASCTKSKTQPRGGEESVASTSSNLPRPSATTTEAQAKPPSCGREKQTHGEGYDEAARTCLWDAYRAGRPAELELTRHTIEGDPITWTLRVRSGSSIEVTEDNRDRFGVHGVRTASCTVLERSPSANGRSGFIVRGCGGSTETIEVP